MRRTRYAEPVLLTFIINKFGGLNRFAKKLAKNYWIVSNWNARGMVPIKELGHVSSIIKVPPMLLNGRLIKAFGVEDWKKEVRSLTLISKEQIDYVLSLPLKFQK